MSEEKLDPGRFWQKLPERDRRRLVILLGGLALGVTLLLWARAGPAAGAGAEAEAPPVSEQAADADGEELLQRQLEDVLSQVKGAGRVRVAVRCSAGAASVYAMESADLSDSSSGGGEEQLRQEQKLTVAAVNDRPVLVRREAAAIQGVVVVAEGAGDPLVRERLYAAVRSLLGLKAAQIAVIEGEGSDDL